MASQLQLLKHNLNSTGYIDHEVTFFVQLFMLLLSWSIICEIHIHHVYIYIYLCVEITLYLNIQNNTFMVWFRINQNYYSSLSLYSNRISSRLNPHFAQKLKIFFSFIIVLH